MPDGDGINHVVAALRTALVGRAVVRFDGPGLQGPAPTAGRVIEEVHRRGRHVQILWDDGLVLHTNLRLSGVWHLYRDGEPWRRPFTQLRVAITVPGWVAACFNAPVVESYREFDRYRHPGFGRCGPDLSVMQPPVEESAALLGEYYDPAAAVAEALLDAQVARGIGNVYRSEVLWECGMHPMAEVGQLDAAERLRLFEAAARMLRSNLERVVWDTAPDNRDALMVYGRNGQRCGRCGDTVEVRRIGEHARLLYWCAGCQTAHDPKLGDPRRTRSMDPHPAATKFMADLPWRRGDLAG
ncbi:MAG: DNA-formamidopyrimidine glycosylase family protein [Ilumatobacteraceae bacterium]